MPLTINKGKVAGSVTKIAAKGKTSVTHSKTGATVDKEEIIAMVEVPALHATVGMQASLTINLGDYNNVKMGVSLFFPCVPTMPAVDKTYDTVAAWVDGKMTALKSDYDTVKSAVDSDD